MFQTIPVDKIQVDQTFNCRKPITESSVIGLADDIDRHGLISNISVMQINDHYKVLAGHRRFIAVRDILKWTEVPCKIVKHLSDEDQVIYNLSENFEREDLSFDEEANALTPLYNMGKKSHEIAKLVNKSLPWVLVRKYYLTLPDFVKAGIAELKLNQADIMSLYKLKEPSKMATAINMIRDAQMKGTVIPSVKQAAEKDNPRILSYKKPKTMKEKDVILQNLTYLTNMYPEYTDESDTFKFLLSSLSWTLGEISDGDYFERMYTFAGKEGLPRYPNQAEWLNTINQII